MYSANTAMPMFLVNQKCTYGNMDERDLFCVKEATSVGTKDAGTPRVMS